MNAYEKNTKAVIVRMKRSADLPPATPEPRVTGPASLPPTEFAEWLKNHPAVAMAESEINE